MPAPTKPTQRKLNWRSLVKEVAKTEPPYPVYQFSNRVFTERPRHNPFTGL